MRRPAALVLLAFCCGFSVAAVASRGREKPAPPPPVPVPVVNSAGEVGEVTVRRSFGPAERFKPHSILIGQRAVFVDNAAIGEGTPVTVFAFDVPEVGRVQVAATAVTP